MPDLVAAVMNDLLLCKALLQSLEFRCPYYTVVYGVSIQFTDLETTTSEMMSSNEGALSKSRANPLSPCSVQILSTRFTRWC